MSLNFHLSSNEPEITDASTQDSTNHLKSINITNNAARRQLAPEEQEGRKTEETKEESAGLEELDPGTELNETSSSPVADKKERNVDEDVIKINEEKWPNVNGVYDDQGEWHEWNELTYSYSYDKELIILPYTVCVINLRGEKCDTESSSN